MARRSKVKKEKKQPSQASKAKAEAKRASAEKIAKSPTISMNAKQRAEVIRSATKRIDLEKALKRGSNEKIKEERARIKALGVKMKGYDLGIKLRDLDAGERTEVLGATEETGRALGLGEQLTMFAQEQAQVQQLEKDSIAMRDASKKANGNGHVAPPAPKEKKMKDPATIALPSSTAPAKDLREEQY